ncbi:hypothetical protein [Nitrosopumilus sp.]|uniref:hypothetical protein n=1 Tax=Nitrosopumilus sp. TaxID=2024843 RepID=UPI00292D5DE8|nr:hypothetical protein [Nitrosopumilus sp.]
MLSSSRRYGNPRIIGLVLVPVFVSQAVETSAYFSLMMTSFILIFTISWFLPAIS